MPRIIIIAKAPRAGYAKTRLIPALGEQGSAQLASRLLEHAIEQALAAELGEVELRYAPDNWPAQAQCPQGQRLHCLPQGEGDLGARMARASQQALAQGQSVILMGTDCPSLTASVLRQLSDRLKEHRACIVPAEDGGYVALGLNDFHSSIFQDIHWSTEHVAEQTRNKMQQLGWDWHELATLADIDEACDLQHLPGSWKQELGIKEVDQP